jgi:hypothetical protein
MLRKMETLETSMLQKGAKSNGAWSFMQQNSEEYDKSKA